MPHSFYYTLRLAELDDNSWRGFGSQIHNGTPQTQAKRTFSTTCRRRVSLAEDAKAKSRPIVIGASGIDTILHLKEEDVKVRLSFFYIDCKS